MLKDLGNRDALRGGFLIAAVLALLLIALAASAQEPVQKVFATPDEAVQSLIAAVKASDTSALLAIFGPEGKDVVSSGDEVADKEAGDFFLAMANEGYDFEKTQGGQMMIDLGEDDWPFPIALAKTKGGWRFDTESGLEEIIDRRIGRNELLTLATCRAYVDGQLEYFAKGHDGNPPAYAQKLMSEPGKHDGLYWQAKEGEGESPLGPLVAEAYTEGYRGPTAEGATPFHGYYFKILKAQGKNAAGGERDYVKKGLMTGGFALVAWPATYGNSGVMTFLVNQTGVVYQKDLGEKTAELAPAMTAYDPDNTWEPTAD